MKNHFFVFIILALSYCASAEEKKFPTKNDALKYYMEKNNHAKNAFQISEEDMNILNIDGKGGDDILIINANYSGPLNGDGGGVFLCQGKEKDCSDGYFCEADVVVFYKKDIKIKGPALKCKK